MKRLVCILLFAASAWGQDHKFWDKKNLIGQGVNTGFVIADTAKTCVSLSNHYQEIFLPTQRCSGVVAFESANIAGSIGLSWFLHKKQHHKLERFVPYLFASGPAVGISYSFYRQKNP